MLNINWYIMVLTIVTMSIVGFSTFDNTTSALIFGIIVGGIFGAVISSISSERSTKEKRQ